jgi:hypothetical protein
MQRVFEQHVRRGDLVDNSEIEPLAPEFGKPAADNALLFSSLLIAMAPRDLPRQDHRRRPMI